MAAHVHRTGDPFERQPAVVVMGSWLTVKEQMADLYASALADRGYSAVTFDFTGFGASGGTLRQTEMPTRKVADIAAAIRWVSSLSFVVPAWANEMTEITWAHWLTFDGLSAAGAVDVPTLFVHSDGCVFPDHVRDLARALKGPVTTVWGDGKQTDFYDRPNQAAFALDAIDDHFRATMPRPVHHG